MHVLFLGDAQEMKRIDYNKWLNHTFSSSTVSEPDYIEFQKEMRTDLKRIAQENDLTLHTFNKNHYCFSAVLKDNTFDNYIYISISDVRYFKNSWYDNVLIRTMQHDKDWTGGHNNYCKWDDIGRKAIDLLKSFQKQERDYDVDLELDR